MLSIYSGEIAIHHLHGQSEEVAPLFTTIFGHRVIEGLQPSLFSLSLSLSSAELMQLLVLCVVPAASESLGTVPHCLQRNEEEAMFENLKNNEKLTAVHPRETRT